MAKLLILLLGGARLWWAFEKAHRRTRKVAPGLASDVTLPHSAPFELYHNALSLCSMKVRFCLAELQIPYVSHDVDLIETGAYETLSRAFLKVNPAGTVPVLVHDGHPIYESHEQIRYAAAHSPAGSPSLVPDDPALREAMEAWVDRTSLTGDPINEGGKSAGNAVPPQTVPIFATMIEKIGWMKILEGLLFHIDRRRPLIFLTLKALGIDKLPSLTPAMKMLAKSRRQLGEHLDALEAALEQGGGPWLLGEQFSLADVSWMVIFERLRQVDAVPVFLGGGLRPACEVYWDRLRARPSYKEAILEHGHPLVDYGMQRIVEAKRANPGLRAALEGTPG
jgi:glutathione S-transferase